ncbi:MAG TPA: alpha/beta hydrolase [Xanthobacteraceae bacterium]|nr:alpha/beta hydrolase [Xanthobacteraceae bacterium]
MPVVKAGAFDLDYADTGCGPALVVVHASASGHRQWQLLAETLRDRYRIIAVNLFGYGKTSAWPATRPLDAADQAELVVAAADLAAGPVVLVGHSLGAAVAFEAAARLAGRVRLLVAFEPALFGHLKANGPPAAYDEIAGVQARFLALAGMSDWDAAGAWFVDYWSGPGAWAAMPDARRRGVLTTLPAVAHEWAMAVGGIRPLDGWQAITAPVHLVHAADTRTPPREVVRLLAWAYPDWTVHEVPSGGHMAPLTRPDLVNPLIGAILDTAEDGRAGSGRRVAFA